MKVSLFARLWSPLLRQITNLTLLLPCQLNVRSWQEEAKKIMALLPELRNFQDMDRFFDRDFVPMVPLWQESVPSANVYETEDKVVAEFSLPGIKGDEVGVEVEDDTLTISAESKHEEEQNERSYYRREIAQQSFKRRVALPKPVQSNQAKADMENGILTVTMPKAEQAKRKSVKVNVK